MIKIGEHYGKLVPVYISGKAKNRNNLWHCKCDCGNEIDVSSTSLSSGNTRSCGCLRADVSRLNGERIRKLNRYDLSGEYGIGYTSKEEPFYFDKEDYDIIKKYTWSYNPDKYVVSFPFGKLIRMHMLVMGSDGSKDVDHINRITYDNQKKNLRICEHYENIIHSKTRTDNTSGRKGVYWDKSRQKWMVSITANKKTIFLGRFDSYEDAVSARIVAENKFHKEFV